MLRCEGTEGVADGGIGADVVELDAADGPIPEVVEEAEDDVPDFGGGVGIDGGLEIIADPVAGGFEHGDAVEGERQNRKELMISFDGNEAKIGGGNELIDDAGLPDGAAENCGGRVECGEGIPAGDEISVGGPVAVAAGGEAIVVEGIEIGVGMGDFEGGVNE